MYQQLTTISSYSLLQSTIKLSEYIDAAKKMGYQTLGLSDRNVLYGGIEFYQHCQKVGIKPIIGMLLDYRSPLTEQNHAIYLFAKNLRGYQKLMRLSSKKMIEEHVLLDSMGDLHDLFGILPESNELNKLFNDQLESAEKRETELTSLFDPESLFYGVTAHTYLEEGLQKFYHTGGLAPCGYLPVRTMTEEETFAVKVMQHIKEGTQISNVKEVLHQPAEIYRLLAPEEATESFQGQTEALANNQKITQQCQLEIPLHQTLLPHYPLQNQTAADYLRELCLTQLPQRIENVTEEYQKRLDYELSIIHKMGFDDYFLIVWDVMDFAHRSQIVTGAGRGSAAGSLVAYVLSITDVDPIQYELLFERFLNPERYTMPDIDLDIPDNRREEVLLYLKEKYGQEYMAQIATFGTMAAKMVLRDVARVFGLSQSEANRWSKAIPNTLKITLEKAYAESSTLRDLVAQNERNELLYKVAKVLEGLPRHVSTHAAGVVISDRNLLDLVPLQQGSEGIWLTQFTMTDVETVGLLKMDFLGLRNLSIIDNTLKGISKVLNKNVLQKDIPLDDAKTLSLFQQGETSGVFQFESAGIRNVLKKLGPESIEDVAAVNALYRPGPMQNIDTFIRRKKGQEKVTYPDESLVPILKNTYGIIVYQEQIMQVASKMAGFSLGQADILRRAISKKKSTVLDEERRHFVSGSVEKGYDPQKANEVYDYIERFANYGFNRSHAFAYSVIGFQMAYLKVHYPAPFFAAILHSVRNNPTKVKEYLNEASRRKISILPPAINKSGYSFQLQSKVEIRFGLGSLKGVRKDFIQDILSERKENGAYTSLDQFLLRLYLRNGKWLKLDYLLPLVSIGAFDELEKNRRQAVVQLEGKIQNILYSQGSMDLLETMALKEEAIEDFQLEDKLSLEEEYLGVYISGHPVEQYQKLRQIKHIRDIAELVPAEKVRILIYIRKIREIRTKKGEQMAFLEGTDASKEISITAFPILYRKVRGSLSENMVAYVEGKVETSRYNGELQLIADKIESAEKVQETLAEITCYLKITREMEDSEMLTELSQLLKAHPGNVPVVLFYESTGKKVLLTENTWITADDILQEHLRKLAGEENVVFK